MTVDILLLPALVATVYMLVRTRKLYREAMAFREETKKAYGERAETMVGALENLAAAACPLCASAAGRVLLGGPDGELTAEAEMNGEHVIHIAADFCRI